MSRIDRIGDFLSELILQPDEDIGTLEKKILRVESILILLSIGAIASGDYLFGPQISLGYLYLIPLSYSALTHRWIVTALLVVFCVIVRQWLGPLEFSSWWLIARDWILTGIFLSVVTTLHRLGRSRHRFFETAQRQRDELLREIRLGAEVQRQLLSRHRPPEDCKFTISARTYPAKVVGGDYYDFISLNRRKSAVVIADVAGKGLPAALLMPAVKISLRTLVTRYEDPTIILSQLNGVFYEAIEQSSYATLFLGIIDLETGQFNFVNGGHQPPILLKSGNREIERLTEGGPPVGLLPDSVYRSAEVLIEPGDLLVLYTDGVVEAENSDGEAFGAERLEEEIMRKNDRSPREIIEAIHGQVAFFSQDKSAVDDLTIIVLQAPANKVGQPKLESSVQNV
jgi:serine phosphatase RsbU (regulator of sigma subunit)